MIRKTNMIITLMLLLVASGFVASCSSDDEVVEVRRTYEESPYNVTVIMSPSGPGDNGYNDRILDGLSTYAVSQNKDVNIVIPDNIDEARSTYQQWLEAYRNTQVPSMLILASSVYDDMVKPTDTIGTNGRVLLFESHRTDLPERAMTFCINRYGTSYLAGAMVSTRRAHVIAATSDNEQVNEAVQGFCDGFQAHHADDAQCSVYYLADDYRGFNRQSRARQLTDSLADVYDHQEIITPDMQLDLTSCYSTYFPVAGSSNQGVYNGVYTTGMQQAIGMDKDCADFCDNIPFSIDIAIDKLIEHYLTEWEANRVLPQSAEFGMESGYINIAFSTTWHTRNNFRQWDAYTTDKTPIPTDFWQRKCELYKAEALTKEKEYEDK